MTNAINFNWFYHNNCKEFQGIKNRIWECNNPTEKQLAEWKAEHSAGYKATNSYLKWLRQYYDNQQDHWGFQYDSVPPFTEFVFDELYQTGAGAPWLKG